MKLKLPKPSDMDLLYPAEKDWDRLDVKNVMRTSVLKTELQNVLFL